MGEISQIKTTRFPRNRPSPMPSMMRPTMNIASEIDPASIAAPTPKIKVPIEIPLTRPQRSARWPAKKEDRAAGIKIQETMRPWIVEFSLPPNADLKYFMSVAGPMMPVSMPNRRPLAEHKMLASRYLGGLLSWCGIKAMALI